MPDIDVLILELCFSVGGSSMVVTVSWYAMDVEVEASAAAL
jgi:hypothetical protein